MMALLITVLIVALVAYVAVYVIRTMLPEPVRMIAMAIVGVILLLVLLGLVAGRFDLALPR